MTTLIMSAVVSALLGSGTTDSAGVTSTRSSFLGMDVCLGQEMKTDDCDIRIFPSAAENTKVHGPARLDDRSPAMSFDVLGMTVCWGAVPSTAMCDLRLESTSKQE